MEYISKLVSIDAILNWYTQMLKRKSYRNFRSNHSVIKNWLKSHSELVIIYSPWFYYSKPGWCSFFTYHFMFLEFARPMLDCLFFWKLIFSFADDVFWFILGTGFHNKSANSTTLYNSSHQKVIRKEHLGHWNSIALVGCFHVILTTYELVPWSPHLVGGTC